MSKLFFTSSLLCLTAAAAILPVGCASGSAATESVGSTSSALAAGSLVISQVFGGDDGAVLNQDFVEIFNPTKADVPLAGLSLQLAAGSGDFGATASAIVPLTGSVKAGHYYLVGLHKGAGANNISTPDATGTFDLSSTDAKAMIATGTDPVECGGALNCGTDTYLDLVGYGAVTQFEGTKITGMDASKSAQRKGAGCTDTNNNKADFDALTVVTARNSSNPTAAVSCGSSSKDAGGDATPPIGVTDPDLGDEDPFDSGIKTDAGKSNISAGTDDSGCSVGGIGVGNASAMGLLFVAGFAAVAGRRRRK